MASRIISAIGISMLQRCEAGAAGFEGFRELTGAESLSRDFGLGFQPWQISQENSAAKIRRRKCSRQYSGNLLANDAWIILRQIEASLMLLL
jgi:hypothetical protein